MTGAMHRTDGAYRLYVTVLLGTVLLAPSLHTLVVLLATPGTIALLLAPELPTVVLAATVLLLGGAVAAGTVRGPVLLSPFRVHLVAGGPLRRRDSLRGTFLVALGVLVIGGALLGAVPGLALAREQAAGAGVAVGGSLLGAVVGALVAVAWLGGQALSRRAAAQAVLALVVTGLAVGTFAPVLSGSSPVVWYVVPAALAVGALCAVPWLLDHLRGPLLLEQARRWQSATTAGGAGDLAAALATYRVRPRRSGPVDAVAPSTTSLPLLLLRRDLVGASRTPARSLVAVVVLAGALFLSAWAVAAPGAAAWWGIAASSVLGYLALGVWSDGFRLVVEASAAPTLYGLPDRQLLGLHALLPVVLVLAIGTLVGLAVLVMGGPGMGVVLASAAAVFGVVVRMYDSAKGPLPLVLLTPSPTPMGDASAIPLALWLADSLILAALVPVAVGMLVTSQGPLLVLGYLPAVGALLLGLRRRLGAA